MKDQETIFKVGDKVFDFQYGWGNVISTTGQDETGLFRRHHLIVMFKGNFSIPYLSDGRESSDVEHPSLSFTEYDLVNGGFSQERPLSHIEKDTLIYVRAGRGGWSMRYFSHFNERGEVEAYIDQKISKQTSHTVSWNEYSLTNPLTEGITK